MDTNDLIRTLAADNDVHERPVGNLLLVALVLAVPVSTALFLAGFGVRSDVMTAMRNPFFDLKFVITMALAAAAIAISLHLSRPEASLGRWAWLLRNARALPHPLPCKGRQGIFDLSADVEAAVRAGLAMSVAREGVTA